MNSTLTGSALTLHNLGLATAFGGSLFGQMALHPAVRAIDDEKERGALLHEAWSGFSPVNAIALGSVVLTWIAGRTAISGGEIDSQTRGLVLAKDVLVGLYAVTGIGAQVVGRIWGQREPPVESGSEPSANTSAVDATAQKVVNWLGRVSIVSAAGIIALTAVLTTKSSRSMKWSLLSKLLP